MRDGCWCAPLALSTFKHDQVGSRGSVIGIVPSSRVRTAIAIVWAPPLSHPCKRNACFLPRLKHGGFRRQELCDITPVRARSAGV
jgi:hypothetical protein